MRVPFDAFTPGTRDELESMTVREASAITVDAPPAFSIVPFDREKHGPFVFDTFAKSIAGIWPWSLCPWRPLVDEIKRNLADPRCRAVVAVLPEDPDTFLGWALTRPARNEVVFAYTRHAFRRRWGIGHTLIESTGVDLAARTAVRFWTRAAERIARKAAYDLFFRVTDDEVPVIEANEVSQ